MKLVTIAICLTAVITSNGQSTAKPTSKDYHFPQVGWKIVVPSDFIIEDSSEDAASYKKGADLFEKTYDTTLDFSPTKTLISIRKGQFNNIAGTITPFDPQHDGDWGEMNAELKNMLIEIFQTQAPTAKLDTMSSLETIDGLIFQKFRMIVAHPNNMMVNAIMYSRLHRGFDFGIAITYIDEKIGEELLAIVKSSKFDK